MRRRNFIAISIGAVGAAALPSFQYATVRRAWADLVNRMMRTFRAIRKSRAGLCPDIAVDRLTLTIADLQAAGLEMELVRALSKREWRRLKPPVGYSYCHRCDWHIATLAGPVLHRKLRCIICETEDLHPNWLNYPVLLRGKFMKVRLRTPGIFLK